MMASSRRVLPEILDSLPEDHPDARHSRRDLRWINRLMGNHRWFLRTLPALLRPGERVLELGAGDGEFGRRLARRGLAVDCLDLAPRPGNWPEGRLWHTADLREFDGYPRYGAVVGNLIFHQFDDPTLARLGATLGAAVRVIVAREPARSRLSRALFAGLALLLRANRVTRHDGRVSIDAGFLGDELPRALRLDPKRWTVTCGRSLFGASIMIAVSRL
jgi:SAM-dependent methyltransferase